MRDPAMPKRASNPVRRAEQPDARPGASEGRFAKKKVVVSERATSTGTRQRSEPPKVPALDVPEPVRRTDRGGDLSKAGLQVMVIDEDRRGRGGVDVRLLDHRDGRRHELLRLVTDAQGRAEQGALVPGKKRYLYVTAGNLQRSTRVELQAGKTTEVTVVMPRSGAVLEGVVRHKTKGPLANVRITLDGTAAGFDSRLQATTDSAGNYRIDGVPLLGRYFIDLEGEALGDTQRRMYPLDVVSPGVIHRDFDVGHVSLRGVVEEAGTNRPLPGVTVNLFGPFRGHRTTDLEGVYRFCDLPEGPAGLLVLEDGFGRYETDAVTIAAGKTRSHDIVLKPAAILHVYLHNLSDKPVVGQARIRATGAAGWMSHGCFTDESGHYVCRKLMPGTYTMWAVVGKAQSEKQSVEIKPGENTVHFQMPDAKGEQGRPSLRGTVVDAKTALPVGGVFIMALTVPRRFASTDAHGVFCLRDLPPGKQAVHFSKAGYGYHVMLGVLVVKDGERELDKVALEPAATLHLRVSNAQGRPVCGRLGLRVVPEGGDEGWTILSGVRTDEKGRATFKQIVPGSYVLHLKAHDRSAAAVEAVVHPGENTIEVRLE
jgi:5-hydroxyisourate hydrolase-like protein (transthyretin family)